MYNINTLTKNVYSWSTVYNSERNFAYDLFYISSSRRSKANTYIHIYIKTFITMC